MVRQAEKRYMVKRRNKQIFITKEELKALNLRLVAEFKTATPERRGAILSEYYDMNKPFVTYFPQFHGDYREEIINTFVTKIPDFFLAFDPARKIDVNSYLSMYCKKHAVREFLFLHTTVQYNKFVKDENGRQRVEKAQVISMDGMASPGGVIDDGDSALDGFLGDHVFDNFLNGNDDAAETFLDGVRSYKHYFEGLPATIIQSFEDGLRWHEVMENSGLTTDRFLSTMAAIRMQLQRIFKREGRDVRFITKPERTERKKRAVVRENRRAVTSSVPGTGGVPEKLGAISEAFNRRLDGYLDLHEGAGPQAADPMEDIWQGFEEEAT